MNPMFNRDVPKPLRYSGVTNSYIPSPKEARIIANTATLRFKLPILHAAPKSKVVHISVDSKAEAKAP